MRCEKYFPYELSPTRRRCANFPRTSTTSIIFNAMKFQFLWSQQLPRCVPMAHQILASTSQPTNVVFFYPLQSSNHHLPCFWTITHQISSFPANSPQGFLNYLPNSPSSSVFLFTNGGQRNFYLREWWYWSFRWEGFHQHQGTSDAILLWKWFTSFCRV